MEKEVLRISGLNYSYAGGRRQLFNGLTLSLLENRIYGLLGKNGTGKSTLLYLICGLLRAPRQSILFDGKDVSGRPVDVLREIYLVPEELTLPNVSLKDSLEMHRRFYPNFSVQAFQQNLEAFELPLDLNQAELSMGQKKRFAMSLALAANTRLLLMDEPTNGLDIPSKSLFRKIVAGNMSEERTILISTHQVHDVEALLDHLVMLDERGVLLNASTASLTEEYTFSYRQAGDMAGVIYAEPTLQGNASIAHRRADDPETQLNLELLFNAVTKGLLSDTANKE